MDEIVKPVFWTTRAKKDLGRIIRFNTTLFNQEKAIMIANGLQKSTEILENPNNSFVKIGEVDDDFTHLKQEYRKLIKHHCKITYREGKTKIYIVRVFDTRQHPDKNK